MNIKKILISLSVIGVVGAVVIGATTAYFSDTETSSGNVITAGALDLTVNSYNGSVPAVVTIKDLKPSLHWYTGPITLKVTDNPGRLYKHIVKDFNCSTMTTTEPECEAEGGTWSGDQCGGNDWRAQNYLPGVTWFDLEIWRGPKDPDPDAPLCDDGAITANCWDVLIPDKTVALDEIASHWIPLGQVAERGEITIRQSFHMFTNAENEYQSDSCTFNEEFMVLQTNAPEPANLWTPGSPVNNGS